MRYKLRTLLILLAILPPLLAVGWSQYGKYVERQRQAEELRKIQQQYELLISEVQGQRFRVGNPLAIEQTPGE
jgi:hypothetical protein